MMLTYRQQQVLDYIQRCIHDRGYPPTVREIGEHMGIRSTNGVNDHIKALRKKGYLIRDEMKSRALRPVNGNGQLAEIPLLGQVPAGPPNLAAEINDEIVRVDRFFIGPTRDVFALQITGDSMIEDGIFDGDYIFVQKQDTAHSGDTVVAVINDEATVKRYYPEPDGVRLQPANASMEPLRIPQSACGTFKILGIVVGIYRKTR